MYFIHKRMVFILFRIVLDNSNLIIIDIWLVFDMIISILYAKIWYFTLELKLV